MYGTSKNFRSVAPSNPLFVDKPAIQIASNPLFWDKHRPNFGPSNPLILGPQIRCGRTKVQDEVGSLVVCHRTTKIKTKKESEKKQGGDRKEYVALMQTVKLKRSGVGFPARSKGSGVGVLTCLVRMVF